MVTITGVVPEWMLFVALAMFAISLVLEVTKVVLRWRGRWP